MEENSNKEQKKKIIRDIILSLHKGLSPEEAKKRIEKEVGQITSYEIAEIEQSLINEGISPDEIKKLCNVHAMLFESILKEEIARIESSAHPVHLFKLENFEIKKILEEMKQGIANFNIPNIKEKLAKLKDIEIHYIRKEQLLFPFLERYGFFGPSKVMWGKDNEIRELLKNAIINIESIDFTEYKTKYLNPLIEEVDGMIFKEENILFPTSMEKLKLEDWIEILKESPQVGYAFIKPPTDIDTMIQELKKTSGELPELKTTKITMPSGNLSLEELIYLFNTLPVDITFVDKDDTVKYFSEGENRIFVRTRVVIGRRVQNCHPPQSVDKVEKILSDFKQGKRDVAEFWINYKGRLIHIRYFAVRNQNKEYLGTLEVTQDITDILKLEGERRLLDEGN